MRLGKILEGLRDQVIHRSQLGKRRLDAAFTKRELDQKWAELGERYGDLARQGRVTVPEELAALMEEIRRLEGTLAEQQRDLTNLEREAGAEKQ